MTAPDAVASPESDQPGRPRWVLALATGGLVLGALVVALLLAEVLIRVVAPQQLIRIETGVWHPQDTVGYTFHAQLDRPINTGERTVRLRTDRDGFRIGAAGRADGDTRILIMGDSFFGALQVEYEQSFPGLVQDRLHSDGSVAVRNAAVPGWDPAQYWYRTASLVTQDSFALTVVGVYIGNDAVALPPEPIAPVEPLIVHHLRWPRSLAWSEVVNAWLRPVNDWLEAHSHLAVFLKRESKTGLMRLGLTPEYFPVEFRKSEATSPRWSNTADILARLEGASVAAGAPVVFLLIPTPFQVDSAVFAQYVAGFAIDPEQVDLEQPTRLLAAAMRERGLEVVDALPAFREAHAGGVNLYGRVDRHLSPEGHELLWEVAAPAIQRSLQP